MAHAYKALEERFRRISAIHGAMAVLHWDTAVMMPRGGIDLRGEQLSTLKRLAHEMLTATETGERIAQAREACAAELDPWQCANLREMERLWKTALAVPGDLVEALTRSVSTTEMVWRDARKDSDFAALAPHLDELVRLIREEARARGEALALAPYDALLEEYQPGLREAAIEPLFAELENGLPPLIDRITARQGKAVMPHGPFPIEAQRDLARELMTALGFDFERGRLDESAHPFCGGVPGDIRITTRYREDEVASAMMAVLHETGHALYEAGLPAAWCGQPVGRARGMAVHESQSLFIEMQTCRSPAFIGFMSGRLESRFGSGRGFEPANLEALYHKVERSLIRVDADEATYPLHIILRWRLERALVTGDLEVRDLPAAWNDGMRLLLGVTPPDDRRGVLQDIHWPAGAIGYFPNYTLGALIAAQLYRAAEHTLPGLEDGIARGRFDPLAAWLRERVHGRASLLPFEALVIEASGEPLGTSAFFAHLERRYLS